MPFTWEHALYRFYDQDDSLLYIGITRAIPTRFKSHAKKQPWWSEVADCRIEFHPDRAALARAERLAIQQERPRFNLRGAHYLRPERHELQQPIAPCVPTDAAKPYKGCTCRTRTQHFGLPEGSAIPDAWLQPGDEIPAL